jgi:Nucleotidyl transferase AbiEii toxin, Type IV TA system
VVADILRSRLERYQPKSYQDLLNAMKEISQELALAALASSEFFKIAAFQGGTCLRIFHGLRRFSEDLDFILVRQDRPFRWESFLSQMRMEFESFGLHLTVQDRSQAAGVVKRAFIKEDSFGKILDLTPERGRAEVQKIRIKLEIDTNPPGGSDFESKILDFPYPTSVTLQDLPTLFASKCHALLCRPFVKGRDWFDFVWYVSNKVTVNLGHLQEALVQHGPWEGEAIKVNADWLAVELRNKVDEIDWNKARSDVEPFLGTPEKRGLDLWDVAFFRTMVDRLVPIL